MATIPISGTEEVRLSHRWQHRLSFRSGIHGVQQFWRKQYVFRVNMTPRKFANTVRRMSAFVLGRPEIGGAPVHIKVDVAPQCQLRCPVCIHGSMDREERNTLPKPMAKDTFRTLVDQVKGRTLAMSLYNLGEPLMNKGLVDMIRYAAAANINTYITTNFSMPMSDDKLTELAHSGLTLLVVAVDGISEQTFGVQRKKGRWDYIESNLRRFAAMRGRNGPRITLQYIVFDHNRHEVDRVRDWCREVGIDDVLIFNGSTTPWLEQFAPRAGWTPRTRKKLPLCAWPYLSSLVGPDGNVYGCCHYRMDENYLRRDEARPLGNIHQSAMDDIYSGDAYRAARRLSKDPGSNGPDDKHFCSGCPVLQGGDLA